MSKKEKATREYLETLSKEQVIDLCLQYINDKNIAEQQLEALMLEISKQEVEQHDLPDYCTRTGTDCTNLGKIEELQQQLAEKDIRIEELEGQFAYECECNKQLVELQKQLEEKQNTIDEINKEFVQAVHDWKALCAEKDKEIEDMDKDLVFNANEIKRLIQEKKRLEQNQKQLAIQELEKAKASADKWFESWETSKYEGNIYDKLDVSNAYLQMSCEIDQQIKELKGEKE